MRAYSTRRLSECLPLVACVFDLQAQRVLEELARLHEQQLPFLLLRFGADALASICQAQNFTACKRVLEYLQRQTGKGVESIIGAIFTDLVWSLVWSLGDQSSTRGSNRYSFSAVRRDPWSLVSNECDAL